MKNVKNIILIGQIRNQIKKHIKAKKIFDLEFSNMQAIINKAFDITKKMEL